MRPLGRPVRAEIRKEGIPVGRQAVRLEVAHGEGKGVVDADHAGRLLREAIDQPFGQGMPRPVSLRPLRWRHFFRRAGIDV